MAEDNNGADLGVDAFGVKANIKNVKSLNTLLTGVAAFGVGLLIYMTFTHAQDARDASAAFVAAIKEQTVAMKEQTVTQREANCLARFDSKDRVEKSDFCRSVTR